MYMKYLIMSLLGLLMLLSCGKGDQERLIEPSEIDELNVSSFAQKTEYVFLNTPDTVLVAAVSGVRYHLGRYYCIDRIRETINVFDESGNFLFQIDNAGQGPGQYANLTDVYVDDLIYILSRSSKRILRYSLDGQPLDQLKLSMFIESIYPIDHKTYLTYSSTGGKISTKGRQAGIGKLEIQNGELVYEVISSFGGDFAAYGSMQSEYFSEAADATGPLLLNPSDTIYQLSEGEVLPRYVIDFGHLALPAEWKVMRNTPANAQRLLGSSFVVHKDQLIEHADYLFLRFLQGNIQEMNYLILDKASGISLFSKVLNNDLNGLIPYEFPISGKTSQELISVISPELLEQYYQAIAAQKEGIINGMGAEAYTEAEEFYAKALASENPVIVITTLK